MTERPCYGIIVNRRTLVQLARYGVFTTISIVLLATFRLYSFTYFWLDDFNCVCLVRRTGFWQMVWYVLDPTSVFIRPLGMWAYWILSRTAGLHFLPYQLILWTLYAVNVALLFLLLRRATKSHYAAAVAVLFFGFRTNFEGIYLTFANIFQLLALALVLIGILLYMRFGYSLRETLILVAIYVLAIRAEEQAIILPALWLAYEFLLRRTHWRQLLPRYSMLAIVGIWFALLKISTFGANPQMGTWKLRNQNPTDPYYLDISILTLGRGYGWFFNALYQTNLPWSSWFIISFLLACGFAYFKQGWALFFLLFTYAALLPYVFLVNHRFEWYWYMPFVGVAGLLGLAVQALLTQIRRFVPREAMPIVLSVVFVAIATGQFAYEANRGRLARNYWARTADEYRSFVHDSRALAGNTSGGVLYYTKVPRHIEKNSLVTATQFALERKDVDAKIVDTCPPQAMCLEFRDGRLYRLR
jgi:hypothetical protein